MPAFARNKWRSAAQMDTIAMRWRRAINRHPFALFGAPFMAIIIGASFMLTPVTAVRYEKYDRRVRGVTAEEEQGLGQARRRPVDMREEYYVSWVGGQVHGGGRRPRRGLTRCVRACVCVCVQKLAAKDIDDWQQKRVKRLPGESDGEI
jgi:cytochrome c oxidase assembly protein subunit 16